MSTEHSHDPWAECTPGTEDRELDHIMNRIKENPDKEEAVILAAFHGVLK